MNKQKLLDLIGPAFLCHEINCKPIEQIINDLADDIMKAFEQPDIREDVEKAAESANGYSVFAKGGDKYNSFNEGFKCGAEWQSQQPIPTVDEDKDEDEFWNKVGAILNGSVSFSMYPKYLATLKQQFSITRK